MTRGVGRARRETAVKILRVKHHRKPHLLEITQALKRYRFLFGPAQGWQEHSGENGDNRDDHQKFDQREGAACRPLADGSICSQLHHGNVSLLRFLTASARLWA